VKGRDGRTRRGGERERKGRRERGIVQFKKFLRIWPDAKSSLWVCDFSRLHPTLPSECGRAEVIVITLAQ